MTTRVAVKRGFLLLGSFAIAYNASEFLHELGHAMAVWMTGVILGGADPMTAILYQIAIMIAIFTGTAVTVLLGIQLFRKTGFTRWGTLKDGSRRLEG